MEQLLSSQSMEDSSAPPRRPRPVAAAAHAHTNSAQAGQALLIASSLLLSRHELEALTGTKQPKRMCDWLDQRGWVFESPSRRGDVPKVDRAYYLARMSGQKARKRTGPQLDFMVQRS